MDNISIAQALGFWSELWKAYYGENGYGGNTAEIYAYTLMPHSPTLEKDGFEEIKREAGLQAAKSLHALLVKFQEQEKCKIRINGKLLGEWFTRRPFLYRCHIKVIRK